jgi:tetratricopeptide (TPR) repeat protein
MPPSRSRPTKKTLATPPRTASRPSLIFAAMGVMLVCLLVGGLVLTLVSDARQARDTSGRQTPIPVDTALERELEAAAIANPGDADAQAAWANVLSNTGRLEQAIPFYEAAIALRPTDWTLRQAFGIALMDGGKLADAEFQFDRIVESDRANPQGWYYLAEVYMRWTPPREDEAIYAYQQTIATGPETYAADLARQQLVALGVATPDAGTPVAASPTP